MGTEQEWVSTGRVAELKVTLAFSVTAAEM